MTSNIASGTQAIDLSCSSIGSSYVVSDVRMSAISLDRQGRVADRPWPPNRLAAARALLELLAP